MDNQMMTRAALGRMAAVGDLYDARTDNFSGISIFKSNLPSTTIHLVDAHSSDIHLVHSDSYCEKFSKLDVSAELSVSVLAGLFTLEGAGRYLSDKKKSSRTAKSSLLYNIQTKDENLNIYHEDLKKAYAIDAIESRMATHVVTGISWGANSVISCIYEKRDCRDVMEIEGSLSAHLQKMSLSISGKASVEFVDGENGSDINFDVRIFGDILPKNGDLPTTFEGALQLMRQLPSLVGECNGGKGKPLTYRLVPIELLQKYLHFEILIDTTLKSLDTASLLRVVHLFDRMTESQQQLNTFHQDVTEHHYSVVNEDMSQVCSFIEDLAIHEAGLRSKLSTLLTDLRSGRKPASELETLVEQFHSSPTSPQNVLSKLREWGPLKEKISLAETLIKNGATYIGLDRTLAHEMVHNFNDMLFVLYFNKLSQTVDPARLIRNMKIFTQEIQKKADGCKFYAVDCDFHPGLLPEEKSSCVQIMEEGLCTIQDLLEEREKAGIAIDESTPALSYCCATWVSASHGNVPPGALKAGRDINADLYVARAIHWGYKIPGKLVPGAGCYVPWGGEEHLKMAYEVLVVPEDEIMWVSTTGASIPSNALPGGDSEGETLYIGRYPLGTSSGTLVTVGKVHRSHGRCYVGFGLEEHNSTHYEILVTTKPYVE